MKNLFKSSLLIFAILITNVSFSKNFDSNSKIKLIETKLIQLTMNGSLEMLEVSVKDIDGEVLYSEKSRIFDISKKYDLKHLPNGSYFIEIESSTKIEVIPFKVLSKSIELNEEKENVFYKPVVRVEGDNVLISKLSLNNEELEILLYDSNSKVLFTENLKGNAILERKLNLMNLNSGNYNLVLRSNGKTFYKTISI